MSVGLRKFVLLNDSKTNLSFSDMEQNMIAGISVFDLGFWKFHD